MITAYQQMVSVLRENLRSFEKSIDSCNVHKMLDENMIFVDTLRNANKTFESLSPMVKRKEVDAHNKSNELVRKYFSSKGRINETCSYMTKTHRSQKQK
jgi:hypothetical protein